jgi:hypothetical protein
VSVTIVIEASKTVLENISVNPTDTIADVRNMVLKLLQTQGNAVVSYNERCLFFLARSLNVAAGTGGREMVRDVTPLGTLKIEPGSQLIWTGPVVLQSDQPAQCFVLTFSKEKKEAVDYFSCKKCKINWVCANCVKSCHAGHEISPYLKAHVPNWACCYCSKKGLCKIDKK